MSSEPWGFHVMVVVRVQRARVFRHTPTAKIWAWIIKVLPFLLVLLVVCAMCFIAVTRVSFENILVYYRYVQTYKIVCQYKYNNFKYMVYCKKGIFSRYNLNIINIRSKANVIVWQHFFSLSLSNIIHSNILFNIHNFVFS